MNKTYNSEFKTQVTTEALRGEKTMPELCSKYEIHETQIKNWKRSAIDYIRSGFNGQIEKQEKNNQKLQEQLYLQIGKLKMENEWLKKKAALFDN